MMAGNAGLLRRLGAIAYDTLLMVALLMLTTIPFIAIRGGESVAPSSIGYQVTLLTVAYVFYVGFWTRRGSTLGMLAWGLRVETPDGRLPTLGQASVRFFAAILSWLPLGLGFIWQLWDHEHLAWHDRLSKTRLRHYPKKSQESA